MSDLLVGGQPGLDNTRGPPTGRIIGAVSGQQAGCPPEAFEVWSVQIRSNSLVPAFTGVRRPPLLPWLIWVRWISALVDK